MNLLDRTLLNMSQLREDLKQKISTFPTQTAAAKAIGTSQSCISDFLNDRGGKYRWSYDRVVEALKKLEANDD